ncbi:substrate-binding domain-containing protein [Bradyrhizobium sp. U87765 SZCCT0131]|nr:substrate-binding domain-containing protein [Bradyrhizobium sp. U87765 SZCCT0131]MBR1262289.1 substrate-binding domain-containing protein [Bradyrhizobium sp. U87765 SZCCT0134]MBR1308528.1 substrate-binding domain-containing protein [Bradyrhizobium sp. U87765 SZCCT0110]MBR1318071.1 substrate-binding domain-containing protein [Bradyrhizobium sp. U87765 SZCCT0109]MBR1351774.1 substrate-binding domain-containing protein [Bradyrhizobium sp. U87765 SZCCT0048]
MKLISPMKLLVVALGAWLLAACSKPVPEFTILSGSENEVLAPLVQEFCKSRGATCTIRYQGSLDIALALKSGNDPAADAVWPAASIWIDMFDTQRRVKSVRSIAQMPVILGVRRSRAQALGWVGAKVKAKDILAAVEGGRLKFLMTSATQSNSGAAAYLAMLAAGIGKPDLIEAGDLDKPGVLATVRALLKGVERTAGSSGWLADLYRDGERTGAHYAAMWNYEAVIKETNDKLIADRQEPLYAIYPEDGVAVADSPLGFVERGRGSDVETFFNDLQAFLLKDDSQARIARTGRRVELNRAAQLPADAATNVDPGRAVTVVRPPEPAVIQKALGLYQEALRRPSLTALCLDLSGSMQGNGEKQLLDAMKFLFTPARTREMLVQWSKQDQIVVLPFNDHVLWTAGASGDDSEQAGLLARALELRAGGGTDFYTCGARALDAMKQSLDEGQHLAAIVIMTDGKSQGEMATFERAWRADGRRVPVFGVTFGDDADRSQLDALARLTGGRVFDGTKNLTDAFRAVRGYN